MASTIASIVRHAPDASLRFIILFTNVSQPRRLLVEATAPNARFLWREVLEGTLPSFSDREYFTRAILFRLALDKLAPADCRRVIYLDSDIVALRDVRELWRIDLGDRPLGAVKDPDVDGVQFARRWGLSPQTPDYFNSGVLLIDLERMRAESLFSAAADFVARHERDIRFADQDALNWALWGRWHSLDVTWNMQRIMVINAMGQNCPEQNRFGAEGPALVHFTGAEKPWLPGAYHPWAWLYWESLGRTPFVNEVVRVHGVRVYERLRHWLRWQYRRPVRARMAARM